MVAEKPSQIAAGRCAAADAQCLRELRESKKYKSLGLTWAECCMRRAGINRPRGISANEYRHIQGSVRNHALIQAGEEIPIQVENVQRLGTAIEPSAARPPNRLRHPPTPRLKRHAASPKTERALRTALGELDKLRLMRLDLSGRMRLQSAMGDTTRCSSLTKLIIPNTDITSAVEAPARAFTPPGALSQ